MVFILYVQCAPVCPIYIRRRGTEKANKNPLHVADYMLYLK